MVNIRRPLDIHHDTADLLDRYKVLVRGVNTDHVPSALRIGHPLQQATGLRDIDEGTLHPSIRQRKRWLWSARLAQTVHQPIIYTELTGEVLSDLGRREPRSYHRQTLIKILEVSLDHIALHPPITSLHH